MQIVIEIDEETYKDIKRGKIYSSYRDVPQESVVAIANGTPLPKGHGRLIDVNELLDRIGLEDNDSNREDNVGEIITLEDFDFISTIIEADGGDAETWNGYHGQVTAQKGTFKRIYEDADGGDAE